MSESTLAVRAHATGGPSDLVFDCPACGVELQIAYAPLRTAHKLLEALEALLPITDMDLSVDRRAADEPPRCLWCGRIFEHGQVFCASDDCLGFQARAAAKEAKGEGHE